MMWVSINLGAEISTPELTWLIPPWQNGDEHSPQYFRKSKDSDIEKSGRRHLVTCKANLAEIGSS